MARTGRPPKPKGTQYLKLGIALPPEMYRTLQQIAAPDFSVSATIRQLLRPQLEKYEAKRAAAEAKRAAA